MSRALSAPPRPSQAAPSPRKSTFRPEIQGLRSLAVLMVVTYHVWFGRVSGGVDVFLLISAFLMTLQFVSKFDQKRPMGLFRHWLHLFRRLLPAAVTVIVAVVVASYLFLPRTRWLDIIDQGWASLFYIQNRLLQAEAVDYYAMDHSLASPLQHFWSLSIQGQVFILWPIIFAACAWVSRRYVLYYRRLLTFVFGAVFVVSLAYSIFFTVVNQSQAYFDTGARLWEFALGTMVALFLPGLKLSQNVRIALGWFGVVAMLSCGILLNVEAAFPGIAALWPTLAAAAVIAAGQTGSRFGVDRILSSRFLVRLGDNSYALYLWHWPLLVIGLSVSGKDHAGWLSGSVIIGTALLLAFLTTRFIEKPWREWKWPEVRRRRAAIAIVAALSVAIIPLSGWQLQVESERREAQSQAWVNNPGARVLDPTFLGDEPADEATLLPAAADLSKDWVTLDGACTDELVPASKALRGACSEQRPSGIPTRSVLVLGDSHAQQWSGALKSVAKANNWLLYSILKGGCKVTPEGMASNAECEEFNAEVREEVTRQRPDAIVAIGTAAVPSGPGEELTPGFRLQVGSWLDSDFDVVALRDNPRFSFNMAECVVRQGPESSSCRPPVEDNLRADSPFGPMAGEELPGLHLVDMTDRLCTDGVCPGVIGNVFVYLDDNHLSATYAASMAEELGRRIIASTGWQ
ncbi:acyltransferase family protein [Pseudarthrobacter sp. PS3-L1]|uniref:acyltransferase family protein n=1 Tax=Pseudarthrobacter sp. PS3-L1 TaxID=3046207 RepID=UPI0024BB2D00|nr:acyltransferase family protein [Pseudarthrobacter sp. PS3-L1]MDJ0321338.1 acyltransferase family protein [Pseudarthrobacter sp. PS3-L1]